MWKFLLAPPNTPFTLALGLLLFLTTIELLGLLLGFGFSQAVDQAVDLDIDVDADVDVDLDVDVDADAGGDVDAAAGAHGPGPFVTTLAWLGLGKVPLVVVIGVFSALFGAVGLTIQTIAVESAGTFMNPWIVAAVALVAALPGVSVTSRFLGKHLYREDTLAVSDATFIGRTATVTLGAGEKGRPTQAKLLDQHGQTHYVLVEPLGDDEVLQPGREVLLLERRGSIFGATENAAEAIERYERLHQGRKES